jgi:hypothetical protein
MSISCLLKSIVSIKYFDVCILHFLLLHGIIRPLHVTEKNVEYIQQSNKYKWPSTHMVHILLLRTFWSVKVCCVNDHYVQYTKIYLNYHKVCNVQWSTNPNTGAAKDVATSINCKDVFAQPEVTQCVLIFTFALPIESIIDVNNFTMMLSEKNGNSRKVLKLACIILKSKHRSCQRCCY